MNKRLKDVTMYDSRAASVSLAFQQLC